MLQLLGEDLASTPQTLGDAKKEAAEDLQVSDTRYLFLNCWQCGVVLVLDSGLWSVSIGSLVRLADQGRAGGAGGVVDWQQVAGVPST